jgi:hypothetical protein
MRNPGIKYLLNISRTIRHIDQVILEFGLGKAVLPIGWRLRPYFVKELNPSNFIRRSI